MVSSAKSFPYISKQRAAVLGNTSAVNGAIAKSKRQVGVAAIWARLFRRAMTERGLVNRETFLRSLESEKIRSERSGKQFALVLLRCDHLAGEQEIEVFKKFSTSVGATVRDIDLVGWYEHGVALGIICREIGSDSLGASKAILSRIRSTLAKHLNPADLEHVSVSWHLYSGNVNARKSAEVGTESHPNQVTPGKRRPRAQAATASQGSGKTFAVGSSTGVAADPISL